jgi:hypothetical protein
LTEDNTTDAGNDQGQNDEGADDSAVIRALRQELKDAQKQLKAQPSRADIEAEARAAVARESAIERELVSLKVPASVRLLVEEKLGDAEVSQEAVSEALVALGFQVTAVDEGGSGESGGVAAAVDAVASLGNQVQAAAQNVQTDDLGAKIAAAETPEQLAQIMRDAGLGS